MSQVEGETGGNADRLLTAVGGDLFDKIGRDCCLRDAGGVADAGSSVGSSRLGCSGGYCPSVLHSTHIRTRESLSSFVVATSDSD